MSVISLPKAQGYKQDVFVKHGCPRRQQSQTMAKMCKSYILNFVCKRDGITDRRTTDGRTDGQSDGQTLDATGGPFRPGA